MWIKKYKKLPYEKNGANYWKNFWNSFIKIFEIFEMGMQKKDYLKILIHDNFIWNQIRRTNNWNLYKIINKITEDDDKNLSSMTDAINYFKLIEELKKINIDVLLKISEIGSSIDIRFPKDAEPKSKLKEKLNESIISNDIDMRYQFLEVDIDEYKFRRAK